jgi:hypothetical protein
MMSFRAAASTLVRIRLRPPLAKKRHEPCSTPHGIE